MTIHRSTALRNAALTGGYKTQFDAAGSIIRVYSGTQPATADTAPAGTLLVTLTLANPAFAAPANGAMAANAIGSGTAVAAGTATWCRFQLSGDLGTTNTTDKRMDLAIGTDIAIDNANIVVNAVVACSGWTYNEAP